MIGLLNAPCPTCGAYSLTRPEHTSVLLAVCDVLVIKALEDVGKRIVRADRSRFGRMKSHPYHEAHTIWPPDDDMVQKALRGAWDVVQPLIYTHGYGDVTPRQVTEMLDEYVHDLAITGTLHTLGELSYRMNDRLGLPVHVEGEKDDC